MVLGASLAAHYLMYSDLRYAKTGLIYTLISLTLEIICFFAADMFWKNMIHSENPDTNAKISGIFVPITLMRWKESQAESTKLLLVLSLAITSGSALVID